MTNDQKKVEQRPVLLGYIGEGAFRQINNVHVPECPAGSESQQLFDWAVLHYMFMETNTLPPPMRMRLVEAYTDRWGIVVEEWEGDWPPPPPDQR